MSIQARPLVLATLAGTILQVFMVMAGHTNADIASMYAVGGMGFSLAAGMIYGVMAQGTSTGQAAIGGLLAGAICALIGIGISWQLGDVPASLLALGTLSSAVTGGIGGAVGRIVARRETPVKRRA